MANPLGKSVVSKEAIATVVRLSTVLLKDDGNPNWAAIAREAGVARSTIPGIMAREDKVVEFSPAIHTEHEPIEDVLARKRKGFERLAKAQAARDWFPVKVREDKPYGLLMFGDPHIDDDGCNVPLLEKHLAIAARPGVYSLNIGDTSNNWVGRLERLYASQEVGRNTGRRLVEWFMWDSGATWLCWILGNHDLWNEGADFHMRLAQKKIPVIDWRAQFKIVHPSGTEARIDASHGRKGSSIWNNLHATLRAAKLGELADAYLTGHTHNYGCEDLEIAERKHSTWLVQLRGYKWNDSYALHNNFAEHQRGSSVLAIIDPRKDARRVVSHMFEDVEAGADYLAWLRR